MSGLEVITEVLSNHPSCAHGPTLLFSRKFDGVRRNFFACSACRDRKLCNFFLEEDDRNAYKPEVWQRERAKLVNGVDHRKLFLTLNQMRQIPASDRAYCHKCSSFQPKKYWIKHKDHDLAKNISDYQIAHPSEFLPAFENAKKEAQFLFSQNTVSVIVNVLEQLSYKKVVNIGTPRIHEFVINNCAGMDSFLMDFDRRYQNFYGPLQFCWYNSFNHHFFLPESAENFHDFIKTASDDLVLILDPPFGGRVEPLAQTIREINKKYQQVNGFKGDIPVFWFFPYFMESQILNSLPEFTMLDYKVDYENHPLFQDGARSRKFGSPVRIFTNVSPGKIVLPISEGYRFCKVCDRWVSSENLHCKVCKKCASKDGRTYVHCVECERCVKPSWQHCTKCDRCCQPDHKCGVLVFERDCFHCKQPGHKKRDCPLVNHTELHEKRKQKSKTIEVKNKKKKSQ